MRDFFKPEMFSGLMSNEAIANEANRILNAEIEKWPVVYGEFQDNMIVKPFGMVKGATDNHTARLAFIEEIKKECVKHEPLEVLVKVGQYTESVTFDYSTDSKCKHCGVELEASWSEKKR